MADPRAIPAPKPSTRAEIGGVLRGLVGLPRLALDWRSLPRPAATTARPVLVVPGFMTGDPATAVLRAFLTGLGHPTYGWGLGRNRGDLRKLLPVFDRRLHEIAERHGQPVELVGWSLGGVIARESTRARPEAVAGIVTMGTPVIGGPKYTASAADYRRRGFDLDELERQVAARNAEVLPVPITAIYSKRDGIVSWQACIDPNPDNRVEHVEVDVEHAELGFSPTVLRLVAACLATRP